jgi:putative endonuclease
MPYMQEKQYFVYILANTGGVLCVGMTNNLEARVDQHKNKRLDGFTKRYNVTRLVYCEATTDVLAAIAREKPIKGWRRSKKITLIESMNAQWRDRSAEWRAPAPHAPVVVERYSSSPKRSSE